MVTHGGARDSHSNASPTLWCAGTSPLLLCAPKHPAVVRRLGGFNGHEIGQLRLKLNFIDSGRAIRVVGGGWRSVEGVGHYHQRLW